MKNWSAILFYLIVSLFLVSCKSDKVPSKEYKTKYIFVLVVDGPRYSETWGDPSHSQIPKMDSVLSSEGVINTHFYNNGVTFTVPGHTAIATGFYQNMDNTGLELPNHPSYFQLWLKSTGNSNSLAWFVASKDKIQVLANCSDVHWKDHYLASTNCGVNGGGVGSGYREDSLTYESILSVITQDHPHLLFVNFREPDYSGHQGDWLAYLKGIKDTDQYVYDIWQLIQTDPFYKDKTTLFVTNDHGRHLDAYGGFTGHGDNCEGCKHINFYAFGPDFKKNIVIDQPRELVDIHATILELLGLNFGETQGKVMEELFLN